MLCHLGRLIAFWLLCATAWPAAAVVGLRIASGFDPQSMDPHAVALV